MKKLILSIALCSFIAVGSLNAQTASAEKKEETKTACCKKGDHKSCKKDAKVCTKDSVKCYKNGKKCEHGKK